MRRRIPTSTSSLIAALCAGCGATSESEPDLRLALPVVDVAPGEEIIELCQSVTLDNDETLYVQSAEFSSVNGGWHHSNWYYAPEEMYPGPDGTWPCDEREFDFFDIARAGGLLFFQSTQVLEETQGFPDGVAIPIPPRSKVVVDSHALNVDSQPLRTSLRLDLTLLQPDEVEVELTPFLLEYRTLAVPPGERSEFVTTCDLTRLKTQTDTLELFHFIPHYHAWGEGVIMEALRAADDGSPERIDTIYDSSDAVGHPLGTSLSPPFDLSGYSELRFGCKYDNNTDRTLEWGWGDEEMCAVFGYGRSEVKWGGGALIAPSVRAPGPGSDGRARYEAGCLLVTL